MIKKVICGLTCSAFTLGALAMCVPMPKMFTDGNDIFDNNSCVIIDKHKNKGRDGRKGRDGQNIPGYENGEDGEPGQGSWYGQGGNGGDGGNGV